MHWSPLCGDCAIHCTRKALFPIFTPFGFSLAGIPPADLPSKASSLSHLPFPAPSMARGGRQKAAVAAPVVKDPARYKVRARLIALAARSDHPLCGSSCVRLNPHELLFESLPLTD